MPAADDRTVTLAIPCDPEYLVFARLALGAICRLTSLRPDEVLDLKLAVTEAAAGALDESEEPRPAPERIGFSFRLDDDHLTLEVEGALPADMTLEERLLGKAIVEATVDSCESDGTHVRLEKRLSPDGER